MTVTRNYGNITHRANNADKNMNNSFDQWLEIADMPERINGEWVDLETGFTYNDFKNSKPARSKVNDKAIDARAVAKFFGGKALTGTVKQKSWAEEIRAKVLNVVDADAAILLCNPTSLCKTSKFWIENRAKSAADFAIFIATQQSLLAEHGVVSKKATKGDDVAIARMREIAEEYNELTEAWGFGS